MKAHRGFSARLRALILVFACAVAFAAVRSAYGTVTERRAEWQQAYLKAEDATLQLISDERASHKSPSRRSAIASHYSHCFPTESPWFWARFRGSASEIERDFLNQRRRCLLEAAEGSETRAWNPPPERGI